MDPNHGNISLTEKDIYGALSAYKQICVVKKKKPPANTMDLFLKRVTPPEEEPQAGPPGGGPGEGSVIIGADSSVRVTEPEDPPVGPDVILTLCRPRLMCVLPSSFLTKSLKSKKIKSL